MAPIDVYLIMKKRHGFDPSGPSFDNYSNNPNFPLLAVGVHVIVEMEWEGEICYMGYGDIGSIRKDQFANYNPVRTKYLTKLRNFTAFDPPRMKDEHIRKMLQGIKNYNWTDDIRPVPKEAFDVIVSKCTTPDPNSDFAVQMPLALDSVDVLLSKDESEVLEFKATMITPVDPNDTLIELQEKLRKSTNKLESIKIKGEMDTVKKELVKNVELEVIETIAAFLNGDGGTLVLGIKKGKDKRNFVFGIETDYEVLKDWDGWYLHLVNLVKKHIEDVTLVSRNINVRYDRKDGKTIARITVTPRGKATWILVGARKEEKLPVRNGPRTDLLSGKGAADYIVRHSLFRN